MGQTGPPNPAGQAYPGAPVTVPTSGNLYPPTQPSTGASPRSSPKPAAKQAHASVPTFQGTVRSNPGFNAQNEAEILRKAMKVNLVLRAIVASLSPLG